jgi:hypothetical protein
MPIPLQQRRGLLIATALVALGAHPVQAADSPLIARLRQRLAAPAVLRGQFEQRKTLQGFKNPLVSRGDFLVARGRGVVWRTREPQASTLVVTRDRLVSRQADGSVAMQVEAAKEPGIRAVNEMLFAVMSADLQALAGQFTVDGSAAGTAPWKLALQPSNPALRKFIARAELEGDRFVTTVRLWEGEGDSSVVTLTGHTAAAELTPEEAARFD